jgi:hypothetical protein
MEPQYYGTTDTSSTRFISPVGLTAISGFSLAAGVGIYSVKKHTEALLLISELNVKIDKLKNYTSQIVPREVKQDRTTLKALGSAYTHLTHENKELHEQNELLKETMGTIIKRLDLLERTQKDATAASTPYKVKLPTYQTPKAVPFVAPAVVSQAAAVPMNVLDAKKPKFLIPTFGKRRQQPQPNEVQINLSPLPVNVENKDIDSVSSLASKM